mmetsp:Transcript_101831/g.270949  ORF Transcript_101831/g.270949 Transcript_101831/m.270949 type:complete len:609 (-) Transcript_101831:137-1963(-)
MAKLFGTAGLVFSVCVFFVSFLYDTHARGCSIKSPHDKCIPYTLTPPSNETCMALGGDGDSTAVELPATFPRYVWLRQWAPILGTLLGVLAMLLDSTLSGALACFWWCCCRRAKRKVGPPDKHTLRATQAEEYRRFSQQLVAAGGMVLPFTSDFCVGYFSVEICISYLINMKGNNKCRAFPFALCWTLFGLGRAVHLYRNYHLLSQVPQLPSPCDYLMDVKVGMIRQASLLSPVLLAFHVLELGQLIEGWNSRGPEGAARGEERAAPGASGGAAQEVKKLLQPEGGFGDRIVGGLASLLGLIYASGAVGTVSGLEHIQLRDWKTSQAAKAAAKAFWASIVADAWTFIMWIVSMFLVAVVIMHVLWCIRCVNNILTKRQGFAKDSLRLRQPSASFMTELTEPLVPHSVPDVDLTEGGSVVRKWLAEWEDWNRATFVSILIMDDVVSIIFYMIAISALSLSVTDGLHYVGMLTGQRIDVQLDHTRWLNLCTFWQSDIFALVSVVGWAVMLLIVMSLCLRANSMASAEASFIDEQRFQMWQRCAGLGTQELAARGVMLEHLAEYIKTSSHTATILGFPITKTLVNRTKSAQIVAGFTFLASKFVTTNTNLF